MLLFALFACPEPEPDVCSDTGTGTLDLVLDLPAETWATVPAVEVYDADGAFVTRVESDTTVELPAGLYTLAALRGTVEGAPVGRAYGLLNDTVQRACIVDGEVQEWAASWELQPSSGKLWALSGEAAHGFDVDALATGGDVEPVLTINVDLSNDLRGFAVDAMGNLWVATSPTYGARLEVYPPGGADGSADPLTLGGDVFADAVQIAALAFDAKNQLWVLVRHTSSDTRGVWGFSAEQTLAFLAEGTVPGAPAAVFEVDGMVAPESMIVGPDDRLWIADFASEYVFALAAGQSASGGAATLTPEVAFTAGWDDETGTHTLNGPTGLGFDAAGRLWVNYWTNPALARFDVADTGESLRAPDQFAGGNVLDLPAGLATDRDGRVWYGNDPQDGAGEIIALESEGGTEVARARSATALTPTTLVFDPR